MKKNIYIVENRALKSKVEIMRERNFGETLAVKKVVSKVAQKQLYMIFLFQIRAMVEIMDSDPSLKAGSITLLII